MEFEWDPAKAARNLQKHGVSFDDATAVFDDPNRLELYRPQQGEDRFIVFGVSGNEILAVAHAERGSKIRIISARKATKDEKKAYRRR